MGSIIKNIKQRRSIRRYKDKNIPKKLIKDVIEAGRYAPSSHNSQPWRFVVVTDRKKIKEVSDHIKDWFKGRLKLGAFLGIFNKKVKKDLEGAKQRLFTEQDLFFYDAPLLVLICAKPGRFTKVDCACAAQNMMLAARDLGIGSCWIGYADLVVNRSRKLMDSLGVPRDCKIIGHIIFGYPIKFPSKASERKKEADILKWI